MIIAEAEKSIISGGLVNSECCNPALDILGRNFDYDFLLDKSESYQENNIYEIQDLSVKLIRTCSTIKISFYDKFCHDGGKVNKNYLKYYKVLLQGAPAENVNSSLSIDNVTWLVAASGNVKAVYEVDSSFYSLDLLQCCRIWGFCPTLQLNKANQIKRITHNGQSVVTPIVPKCYFDFLLERDKRLKEVRQLFEIGSHPMFVRCHEVLECIERYEYFIFVVMDRQSSYSVSIANCFHINFQGYPENENTKKFFYQLLSGLAYWHDRGKAHTDIRPENILCDRGLNSPKIRNFGLSKPLTEDDNIGMVDMSNPLSYPIGTYEYKLRNSREVENYSDIKADIFSVGITMFELLYGAKPFWSGTFPPNFYQDSPRSKHRVWEYEDWALANFNPDLPSSDPSINYGSIFTDCTIMSIDAKNLIAKLTYPDPTRRPSAREAMQHPWFDSISKSCEVDVVDIEPEVKSVEIVNIGYHPIVWLEEKQKKQKRLSSYLQRLLSGIRSNSNSSTSNDIKNVTMATHLVDATATAPAVPSTILKVCTKLLPRGDRWLKPNKSPTELTCLFRTVEQHEQYLQAKDVLSDVDTSSTLSNL